MASANNNMEDRPWFKHYDKGVPHHIDYPQISLFNLLEAVAKRFPNKVCTIFKGDTLSYKEVDELSNRVAAALSRLGIKKGDRVGIFLPNIPQFVITYFGILKAGGVVVALNPLYSAREIEYQVNDAGIEMMFVMSSYYQLIKKTQPNTKISKVIVISIREYLPPLSANLSNLTEDKEDDDQIDLATKDIYFSELITPYTPEDCPKLGISPDDVALFQYSGGTTGISKGAIALHRNLVANAYQFRHWLIGAEDGKETVLLAIPLFHVYCMVAGMLFAICAGASMVLISNPRDIVDILQNLQKYKASFFPGVPTLYNAINNHPDVKAGKYNLSSIKACISGSTPLLSETKSKFETLTGGRLIEGYGLSEAPTATHCNPEFGENRIGSIGLPLPDVDCRIVSLDDGKTVMRAGIAGELIIKSPQVMKGYHHMPEETAHALQNGWLYTGDIAQMDEDGYFYIVDRKDDLIKPGGYQVWPREVEEIITTHPKVLEVGVAGIPDAYRGETVKAWVVLKAGETATADEIRQFCKKNMAVYKVPTHVEFLKELPRTTVGKILRRELANTSQEYRSGDSSSQKPK